MERPEGSGHEGFWPDGRAEALLESAQILRKHTECGAGRKCVCVCVCVCTCVCVRECVCV